MEYFAEEVKMWGGQESGRSLREEEQERTEAPISAVSESFLFLVLLLVPTCSQPDLVVSCAAHRCMVPR